MPDTYADLAKRYQGTSSAAAAFAFLDKGQSGSGYGATNAYYTQALGYAAQHLMLWGLSGHEPSLRAYQGLLRVLPSQPYEVDLGSSELYKLSEQIDDVPRQVYKTKDEAEKSAKEWRRQQQQLEKDPVTRAQAMDARERANFLESLVKDLNERMRQWSSEQPKLKLKLAQPAKKR
ncbi:MAG: hypothetical protein AB7N76_17210 [Planctomycetota bacterium]